MAEDKKDKKTKPKRKGRLPGEQPANFRKKGGPTDKMKQAVAYYWGAARFNKTKALEMAGYSNPKQSHNLFTRPIWKEEMERWRRKTQRTHDISHESLMNELAKVAFSNPADYVKFNDDGSFYIDISDANMDELAALGELSTEAYESKNPDWDGENEEEKYVTVKRVKVKPWNKLSALEMLMKHGGFSKDKVNVAGSIELTDKLMAARKRAGKEE